MTSLDVWKHFLGSAKEDALRVTMLGLNSVILYVTIQFAQALSTGVVILVWYYERQKRKKPIQKDGIVLVVTRYKQERNQSSIRNP